MVSQRSAGVQSLTRAFEILEVLADLGGTAGLSQLAAESALPLPTAHRLVRSLVELGYLRQEASRQYALAPRLVRLGDSAARLLGTWAAPHLRRLVDALGESANLATLDGPGVVYTAQMPGRHAMRMFTEVGRHAGAHCTAVGKAMLAQLPSDQANDLIGQSALTQETPHTITSVPLLVEELVMIREQGFAVDNEEQELGVRCVAVALPGRVGPAAMSVSAPTPRMTDALVRAAVPLLQEAAVELARELGRVE